MPGGIVADDLGEPDVGRAEPSASRQHPLRHDLDRRDALRHFFGRGAEPDRVEGDRQIDRLLDPDRVASEAAGPPMVRQPQFAPGTRDRRQRNPHGVAASGQGEGTGEHPLRHRRAGATL